MVPLRQPSFVSGDSGDFWIDDILFKQVGGDYTSRNTDSAGVVLLKTWRFIEDELRSLGDFSLSRMMEFGLWRGGSAVLWPLVADLKRYVGIDLQPKRFDFPSAVAALPEFGRVSLHWETSQDDRFALNAIMDADLDGPLDLIVDDASHQYVLSRTTFEICFPRLRVGGYYLLEDWPWAHQANYQQQEHGWYQRPALTNLLFDLTLILGSHPAIVSEIRVYPGFALIKRGHAVLQRDFQLANFIFMRPCDNARWQWRGGEGTL